MTGPSLPGPCIVYLQWSKKKKKTRNHTRIKKHHSMNHFYTCVVFYMTKCLFREYNILNSRAQWVHWMIWFENIVNRMLNIYVIFWTNAWKGDYPPPSSKHHMTPCERTVSFPPEDLQRFRGDVKCISRSAEAVLAAWGDNHGVLFNLSPICVRCFF